jgi:hypothetical protein
VRRLPFLQFGYGSSATVTGGRSDSSGTDCRAASRDPHGGRGFGVENSARSDKTAREVASSDG